jgi:hypothetical protein
VGLLALAGGCGVPVPESVYVPMDDGTQIAVDVWLPPKLPAGQTVPAVMQLGRYWRDYQLPAVFPAFAGKYLTDGEWLNQAGYAVVMVDVRGTGASFGVSTAPWSPREVADFPLLVDWVVAQPWSNGKVGGIGVSYAGVTADWLGATRHPAVAAVLPTYSFCDIYQDLSHPGGIFNERFIQAWGDLTARMDRNDTSFLDIVAAANPHGVLALLADLAAAALLGVRPITGAGSLLADAIAQHAENPSVFEAARQIEFRDDLFATVGVDDISPLLGPPTIKRSAAIRRVVGWQDAGSARGALRSFNTLQAGHHVVIIAPETHTGSYRSDPYDLGPPPRLDQQQVIRDVWEAVPFFDAFLKTDATAGPRHLVRYYTYVERQWKETSVWPPVGFQMRRWYLAAGGQLSPQAPTASSGEDLYVVDLEATTGLENRWFSGLSGVPIRYPDRAEQDQRLLVYDSPPLEQDYELTGHPVVSLQVISDHTDGAFYVYLEDVFPDGRVIYLTEGQLRAIHRRVSEQSPPAAVFGPYHTFRREDAEPLVPGEVAEVAFDLLPISTIIRKDHRLRVAIAGHDKDTFVRYPASGTPTLRFQRNADHASWIDMPLKPRGDLAELPEQLPLYTPLGAALCPVTGLTSLAAGRRAYVAVPVARHGACVGRLRKLRQQFAKLHMLGAGSVCVAGVVHFDEHPRCLGIWKYVPDHERQTAQGLRRRGFQNVALKDVCHRRKADFDERSNSRHPCVGHVLPNRLLGAIINLRDDQRERFISLQAPQRLQRKGLRGIHLRIGTLRICPNHSDQLLNCLCPRATRPLN